jgi:hypothetical protein
MNDTKQKILIQYLWYGHEILKPPSELLGFGNNKTGRRK